MPEELKKFEQDVKKLKKEFETFWEKLGDIEELGELELQKANGGLKKFVDQSRELGADDIKLQKMDHEDPYYDSMKTLDDVSSDINSLREDIYQSRRRIQRKMIVKAMKKARMGRPIIS